MRTNLATVLDPTRRSNRMLESLNPPCAASCGPDQAVEKVAEIYQMFLAGG